MTVETFFDKFELFADAPDAVEKMRDLVRHLAVSRRLVDSEGEWDARPLKGLTTKIGSGATPAGGRESYVSTGTPLIRSMNVHFSGFEPKGLVYLSDHQAKELSNATVRANDVLLNITGASIGRVTIAPLEMDGARVNQHVTILRPIAELLPRFLALFLASPSVQWMINDIEVGATRQALTKSMIEQFEIPLPPLAEQKRIVAKVDELMGLCDRLDAQQQEREQKHAALSRAALARFDEAPTPANLEYLFHGSYTIDPADLRKSILTLAVQGRLLPKQDGEPSLAPAIDNGVKLPDGHSRRRKIVKKSPVPVGSVPRLPSSWTYATVQDLYDANLLIDYADGNHGSLYPRANEFGPEGVTFVSAKDIVGGRVNWSTCSRLNDERARQLVKGWAQGGDVLLTHNATVGRVARVEADAEPFLLGTSVTFYRLNTSYIEPTYFYYVLCSPLWEGQLSQVMEQTTRNQVSIQKQAFFVVPLPPFAEQKRIVAKVEALMALVDRLEAQQAQARDLATRLLSAAVAELVGKA